MVKLTVKGIAGLLKSGKRGYAGDGGNLYFKYNVDGKGSWIFRYKWNGKSRDMGLGSYPDISLPDARAKALEARRVLNSGADPLSEREVVREAHRAVERLLRPSVTRSEALPLSTTKRIAENTLRSGERVGCEKWRSMCFR